MTSSKNVLSSGPHSPPWGYVYTIPDKFFWRGMKTYPEQQQQHIPDHTWKMSFAHIQHDAGVEWPRGFSELNPSRHSNWIFTSVSVDSSRCSFVFTSATVRISVQTAPKHGTESSDDVTLYFRCDAASPSDRNHRSFVWTEALYILHSFVPVQELPGKVWT